jgi:hypothetical protein
VGFILDFGFLPPASRPPLPSLVERKKTHRVRLVPAPQRQRGGNPPLCGVECRTHASSVRFLRPMARAVSLSLLGLARRRAAVTFYYFWATCSILPPLSARQTDRCVHNVVLFEGWQMMSAARGDCNSNAVLYRAGRYCERVVADGTANHRHSLALSGGWSVSVVRHSDGTLLCVCHWFRQCRKRRATKCTGRASGTRNHSRTRIPQLRRTTPATGPADAETRGASYRDGWHNFNEKARGARGVLRPAAVSRIEGAT